MIRASKEGGGVIILSQWWFPGSRKDEIRVLTFPLEFRCQIVVIGQSHCHLCRLSGTNMQNPSSNIFISPQMSALYSRVGLSNGE